MERMTFKKKLKVEKDLRENDRYPSKRDQRNQHTYNRNL